MVKVGVLLAREGKVIKVIDVVKVVKGEWLLFLRSKWFWWRWSASFVWWCWFRGNTWIAHKLIIYKLRSYFQKGKMDLRKLVIALS